jgi:hypothetical protein
MKTSKKASDNFKRFQIFKLFHDRGIKEADLGLMAIIVWDGIWRHMGPDQIAKVTIAHLADRLNISKSLVIRAIADLKAKKMLKTIARGTTAGAPNVYKLFPIPYDRINP